MDARRSNTRERVETPPAMPNTCSPITDALGGLEKVVACANESFNELTERLSRVTAPVACDTKSCSDPETEEHMSDLRAALLRQITQVQKLNSNIGAVLATLEV